jgi:armadillo repeat-containing protein 5
MTTEETLRKLLDNCKKSLDKRQIYKNLVEIRANVKNDTQIELFNKTDGVRMCVDLIKKPHEQILEVALSILGNCCTKKEGCEKVSKSTLSCNTFVTRETM